MVETCTPVPVSIPTPQRPSSAFKQVIPVPRPSTPVFRPIKQPGTPGSHPVIRHPTPQGGSIYTQAQTLPPQAPPAFTLKSSLDPLLQDPVGAKAGPQTVVSYHTNMPTHNQAGKFHKVGPPPNFWGASNAAWKRRLCQGNPPKLPLAVPGTPTPQIQPPSGTPLYNPSGNQPPDPSPYMVTSGGTPRLPQEELVAPLI